MEILGSKLLVYPKAKIYQIHWSLLVVNVLRTSVSKRDLTTKVKCNGNCLVKFQLGNEHL